MTANEITALEMMMRLVEEISTTNKDAHEDIIERMGVMQKALCAKIDDIRKHCADREVRVDQQIKDAGCKPSPFEISVKTVAKFGAGLIVYTGLIVGIVTGVLKLAG